MGKIVFTDLETNTPYLVSKKNNTWGIEKAFPFTKIEKLKDYVFYTEFDELDYDSAKAYYEEGNGEPAGACSSFKKGNFYGRSFDWTYDNISDFIVRISHKDNRKASLCFGAMIAELTDSFVSKNEVSDMYKIIPFRIVDGINECGVVVNTNVVPAQKGATTGTAPAIEQKDRICNRMLPRYILDHFETAQEAVEYIRDYISVFSDAKFVADHNYDLHVMVGDKDKCYVLEFVNNELKIVENAKAMTNFFISDVVFNNDGSVYTALDKSLNDAHDPMTVNNITSHGAGLERWNIINNYLNNHETIGKEETSELLSLIKYSNAYKEETSPRWYSEATGDYGIVDITVSTPIYIGDIAFENMKESYKNRNRDKGDVWQTVHSVVYDIENRKAYVIFQEDGKELEFTL